MPKVIREGKLVDIAPAPLSEACRSELNNPAVAKMLVTSDLDGVPHSAPRNIAAVLDEEYPGCIAILEMIEGSQTSKNLLWSYDRQRTVAISTVNPKTGESFLVEGLAAQVSLRWYALAALPESGLGRDSHVGTGRRVGDHPDQGAQRKPCRAHGRGGHAQPARQSHLVPVLGYPYREAIWEKQLSINHYPSHKQNIGRIYADVLFVYLTSRNTN